MVKWRGRSAGEGPSYPLLYERGMGQQAHSFACHPREGGDSHFFSTREGLDNNITSFIVAPTLSLRSRGLRPFHSPLARRERDWTSTSLRLSMPYGLRPLAVILDCVWFASLTRSQSNPLRGFAPCPIETKSGAFRLHFSFQGERGLRTLGPVTVSGFRDRPNRPLWHLSKVCTI